MHVTPAQQYHLKKIVTKNGFEIHHMLHVGHQGVAVELLTIAEYVTCIVDDL